MELFKFSGLLAAAAFVGYLAMPWIEPYTPAMLTLLAGVVIALLVNFVAQVTVFSIHPDDFLLHREEIRIYWPVVIKVLVLTTGASFLVTALFTTFLGSLGTFVGLMVGNLIQVIWYLVMLFLLERSDNSEPEDWQDQIMTCPTIKGAAR